MVAALAAGLTYTIFCSLVGLSAPLALLAALLAAASPGLSPLLVSILLGAGLYLEGGATPLLLFAPLLLLSVYKGLQSWESSLFAQLLSLLILVSGDLGGALLGLLFALSSREGPREAATTGFVLASWEFVLAGYLLPADAWLCGVIKVPGGLAPALSSTPFEIVNVGQFYLRLLEKLLGDSLLTASFFLLPVSALVSSLLAEELGAPRSSIVGPLILAIPPLYSGHVRLYELSKGVLAAAASAGAASLAVSAEFRAARRAPRRKVLTRPPSPDRGEESLFADVHELAELLRAECSRGAFKFLVILGLSLDDERAFLKYSLGRSGCRANVILFHERGGIPSDASPDDTLVFYIPPLTLEEAVNLLARLSGYPRDVLESVDERLLDRLRYLDRTSIREIALEADRLVAGGSPAKRAFEEAISRAVPRLTPELAAAIEAVVTVYPTLGFRGASLTR